MPSAPWFKFFAADYMSSPFVQSLEPEQELWYLRLIIASAINLPRGCLPLANGKLWRLAKAPSLEHFERHAAPILAKFEKDTTAQLYRVIKVFEQNLVASADLSSKRSEAGKHGAAKRWQLAINGDGKLPPKPMATEKQKIADSDSDSDENRLPPTPLREGGYPTIWKSVCKEELTKIWQAARQYLKDDLATAYVNTPHFREDSYDKYFRDSWLVEIRDGMAFLDSSNPANLREGVEKFQSRLRATIRRAGGRIDQIRVQESQHLRLEASA